MSLSSPSREQVSIRLPRGLYQRSREIAAKRGTSMNALVQEGLQMIVRNEQEKALYDSFTLLGKDAQEASVDFAFEAQSEVVLSGD